MARKRRTETEENSLEEKEEVVDIDEVKKELASFDEPVLSTEETEKEDNNITNKETENVSEDTVETTEISVGDKVKVSPHVTSDIVGKSIHNGIRNYTYVVKVVRPDDYCVINCLAYTFTVYKDNLQKI